MLRRTTLFCTLFSTVLFAAPVAAQAATWYVDQQTGNDTTCVADSQAMSCATIEQAITGAVDGDTIQVDNGTYSGIGSLQVDEQLTIAADDFVAADGTGASFIERFFADSISVGSGGDLTITSDQDANQYFRISAQPNSSGISVSGDAEIRGNEFEQNMDQETGVTVSSLAGDVTVEGNTFTGPTDDSLRLFGISVNGGSVAVTDNQFFQLSDPIWFSAGSPTASGNEIQGVYTQTPGGTGGRGITVIGATPTLTENVISDPDPDTSSIGIDVTQLGPASGAILRRNRILDHSLGVYVSNTTSPVWLNGDVIAGSGTNSLLSGDSPPNDSGVGDVIATNVTMTGDGTDVNLAETSLDLNSSILKGPIAASAGASCSIIYSRGPAIVPGGIGCGDFQTTADPMFAADGFHLLAGSPMIDAGHTAAPMAPNALDIDGEARGISGTPSCSSPEAGRRDIGADEFSPTPPASCNPSPTQPSTPQTGVPTKPKKKCKKKKGKKGAAAAKKKCKRKKK